MQVQAVQGDIAQFQADAIIVNLFEGVTSPGGGTGAVDKALGGLVSQEIQANPKAFKGKLGETLILPTYGKIPARYVIIVGLGKSDEMKAFQLRRASAAAIRACQKLKIKTAGTLLHGASIGGYDVSAAARLLTEGALMGNYRFTKRKGAKTGEENGESASTAKDEFETLAIVEHGGDKLAAIKENITLARVIAESTNLARDWVNDSPNYVTPTFLKEQAEQIPGLTCKVLDFAQIKQLGMGAFSLVAQGSEQPPYLIHLTYKPDGKAKKKIALVGKGITFDSGGLSLKPAASMELMKMDMAGAAAVIATMKAIAELKNLPLEVHGFVPTCENMPSGCSSKPGDVVTAMNGKTIEVNNTDAEGRLILCDAITYAQKEVNPDEMLDLATLTGACVVALGKAAAGIMGTNDELIDQVRKAGDSAGEKLWPLPLYDEYKPFLKSDVADIINSGAKGEAGSSAGGMFLKEFVDKNRAWAHLDIAGPAWITADVPEVPKGGSGFGVRTLLYYLYNLA
ncbi:MAG: leucyl aminopeptidase [Vampirovibrio sp.]|jgi:leucyl aminopeptidase|nr:leucyl aminopeptidase [Vampirovibrio sp.]